MGGELSFTEAAASGEDALRAEGGLVLKVEPGNPDSHAGVVPSRMRVETSRLITGPWEV